MVGSSKELLQDDGFMVYFGTRGYKTLCCFLLFPHSGVSKERIGNNKETTSLLVLYN